MQGIQTAEERLGELERLVAMLRAAPRVGMGHTHGPLDSGYCVGGSRLVLTSTTNFIKADHPGLRAVVVRVQGSGGAGGGRTAGGAGTRTIGQGGGGGGYVEKFILASALAASETATVGTGGQNVSGGAGGNGNPSSFGSHCSANGGDGGVMVTDSQYTIWQPAASSGGVSSGGDFMVTGVSGYGARNFGNVARYDGSAVILAYQGLFSNGQGGSSFLGSAGPCAPDGGTGSTGVTGRGYGYGGNGLAGNNNANAAGSNGGPGIVLVELLY